MPCCVVSPNHDVCPLRCHNGQLLASMPLSVPMAEARIVTVGAIQKFAVSSRGVRSGHGARPSAVAELTAVDKLSQGVGSNIAFEVKIPSGLSGECSVYPLVSPCEYTPLCCMVVTPEMNNVAHHMMKPGKRGNISQGLAKDLTLNLPQDDVDDVPAHALPTQP